MSLPFVVRESVELWIKALEQAKEGTTMDWPVYNSVLESMKSFVTKE